MGADATETWLTERYADARAAYPGAEVPWGLFASHVRGKMAAQPGLLPDTLRTRELFLAAGCLARDARAVAYVERETFRELEAAYARFPRLGVPLDDVKQRFREAFLVGASPKIEGYAGAGSLRGWVRAAVLHMLLNVVQRESREEPTDEALLDVVIGAEPGAEAAYVKLACREAFEASFAAAMATLDARERALLRHAFVDGRNVDDIGAVYGVHRATAARWVAAAREALVTRTRKDLVRRLGITETEAGSIIAAALSGVGSFLIARLDRDAG